MLPHHLISVSSMDKGTEAGAKLSLGPVEKHTRAAPLDSPIDATTLCWVCCPVMGAFTGQQGAPSSILQPLRL